MKKRRKRWQRGSLTLKGKQCPMWYGEWREYQFNPDGTERAIHRRVALGEATRVSRDEARAALDKIMQEDNGLVPFPVPSGHITDSGLRAAYAECLVSADLLRQGYEVYKPLNPACRHDFLAIRDGITERIEVKLAEIGSYGLNFSLRRKTGQFDRLAVVGHKGKITYQTYAEAFKAEPKAGDIVHEMVIRPPENGAEIA